MNVPQIRDLILKIIGVYCLVVTFSLLQAVLFMVLEGLMSGSILLGLGMGIFHLGMLAVWIGLTWVFLRRTDAVRRRIWSEDGADSGPVTLPKMSMAFWVAVVGLSAFLQSVDNFGAIGWRGVADILSSEAPASFVDWAVLLVPVLLSAVCVLRAREIGAWISAPLEHGAATPTQDASTEPGEDA